VDGAEVRLQVPPPTEVRTAMALDIPGEAPLRASYVVAGVPYLVLVVEDLEDPWVERVPPTLKTHRAFPAGTNVAVARFDDVRGLRARFFERGVEEETPSSGTGCVAVALLSALLHDLPSPVTVTTAGGDFRISFTRAGEGFADIITGGRVDYACRGEAALSQ
jgi:diaminopimelate epimerase